MSNVINFNLERAVRKSGLHRAECKQMIEDGFDPLVPNDVEEYGDWFSVSGNFYQENNWTDEAIHMLLTEILAQDPE